MVTLKANRPMLLAGSVVCGVVVVALSFVAVRCWQYPDVRDEVFPIVLFFDLVFAYRLYRYVKLIPPKKISN
jgi:hypothetical protein